MKGNKKNILEKINKFSKKSVKSESFILNLALRKLDSENFDLVEKTVYSSDHKRLIYIIGDDEAIEVEEGVEIIGEMALAEKKKLKSIKLPSSLRKIERDAFSDCDALRSVIIPGSVEEIEGYAFSDCDSLKHIYFEGIPQSIHRKSFADCDKLHEISVPAEAVATVRKALHIMDDDEFVVVGRNTVTAHLSTTNSHQQPTEKSPNDMICSAKTLNTLDSNGGTMALKESSEKKEKTKNKKK